MPRVIVCECCNRSVTLKDDAPPSKELCNDCYGSGCTKYDSIECKAGVVKPRKMGEREKRKEKNKESGREKWREKWDKATPEGSGTNGDFVEGNK